MIENPIIFKNFSASKIIVFLCLLLDQICIIYISQLIGDTVDRLSVEIVDVNSGLLGDEISYIITPSSCAETTNIFPSVSRFSKI